MEKLARDAYYMGVAAAVALRGTCPRRQVGAVLVVNDRILSTGYNGAPAGSPECREVGCLMEHGHCVRTLHAEENALLEVGAAALRLEARVMFETTTLYTTTAPCHICAKMIAQCRVARVVCGEPYQDASHQSDRAALPLELLRSCGVRVDWHKIQPKT